MITRRAVLLFAVLIALLPFAAARAAPADMHFGSAALAWISMEQNLVNIMAG